MRGFVLTVALLLGFSNGATARPLDLKQVPADAKWLLLVDIDAVRGAPDWNDGYQYFWRQMEPLFGLLRKGINFKDGLHGASVYATVADAKHPEDFRGAAIISVDLDRNHFVAALESFTGYKTATYGAHEIHTWQMPTDSDRDLTACLIFYDAKTIILAVTDEEARKAADVLDGKAPNITQSDSALAVAIPNGTILLLRGLDLDKVAGKFESPLLKQSESISIAVGEEDEEIFAEVRLTLQSAETAEQVQALINGLRALVQLQAGSQKAAADLFGHLRCICSGKVVNVSLRAPTKELEKIFDDLGDVNIKVDASAKVEKKTPAEAKGKPSFDFKFGVQVDAGPDAEKKAKKSKEAEKPAEKRKSDDK